MPSTKVTETIAKLKTYGEVTNVSLQNQDVTSQATDLDARIDALNVSIKRLEKIMAESTSSDELIKAEGALTERQEQLESMTAQRTSMADQVRAVDAVDRADREVQGRATSSPAASRAA